MLGQVGRACAACRQLICHPPCGHTSLFAALTGCACNRVYDACIYFFAQVFGDVVANITLTGAEKHLVLNCFMREVSHVDPREGLARRFRSSPKF